MWNTLAESSYNALLNLWNGFISFLPALIGGLIVFLIGIIIGDGLGQLTEKIIDALKIDAVLERSGFKNFTDRAHIRLDTGYFFRVIVKWVIILAFLVAACNIWGLTAVGGFIRSIVNYLPNIVAAIFILVVAIIVGEYAGKFVRASVAGAGLKYQSVLDALARWTFYIFGILAALSQLKVAPYITNTLFTGIVAFAALAGGLAFGLGGKDLAHNFMERMREDLEKK